MDNKVKMRAVYKCALEMLLEIGASHIAEILKDGDQIYFVGFIPYDKNEISLTSGPPNVVQFDLNNSTYTRLSFVWVVNADEEREVKNITEKFMNYIVE